MFKHTTEIQNAARYWEWVTQRGGVAVWHSLNLSNPSQSWSTPALTKNGQPSTKPHYYSENAPSVIFTNPEEIGVVTYREYRRLHVAIRRCLHGYKLTSASSRRVEKALADAGDGAVYDFVYCSQECVILAPEKTISLLEWAQTEMADRQTAVIGEG